MNRPRLRQLKNQTHPLKSSQCSHSDPADRFLIAAARNRRATLATHHEKILAYRKAGHIKVLAV